jgi:arylsulfatase A-like enzyme
LQLLSDSGELDSTLVVATSDMGNPALHSSRNLPTVIIGGAQAGIRGGQYLDVRQQGTGVPNNRLLVSLARAFGAQLDSLGDAAPDIANGALDLS